MRSIDLYDKKIRAELLKNPGEYYREWIDSLNNKVNFGYQVEINDEVEVVVKRNTKEITYVVFADINSGTGDDFVDLSAIQAAGSVATAGTATTLSSFSTASSTWGTASTASTAGSAGSMD